MVCRTNTFLAFFKRGIFTTNPSIIDIFQARQLYPTSATLGEFYNSYQKPLVFN